MRPTTAAFPAARFRRLRQSPALRALSQENTLSVNDLIWPVFVRDGVGVSEPVASMPGVNRLSVDLVVKAAEEAATLGIPAICLFPYTDPALKTEDCAEAWNPDNLTNRAIRAIKAAVPEIAVMTDVALDPYNALGHDGLVKDGVILNDETLEALVKQALVQAESGCGHHRPFRHDGRPDRRAQGRVGDGRPQERDPDVLCRQICLGLLRPLPRCRGGQSGR